MQAAYDVCAAWSMPPTARNIAEVVRRIATNGKPGRGFRYAEICAFLRSRNGHPGVTLEQPCEVKPKKLRKSRGQGRKKKERPMKQAAFALGPIVMPEPEADPRESLPEYFPWNTQALRDLAKIFCRKFANCKSDEALAKHLLAYTQTLAILRNWHVPTQSGWQAFIEARDANGGKPLFSGQAKTALSFLADRKSATRLTHRDTCGCPLPEGVTMPHLNGGETAHWDGEEFLFGNFDDPKTPR